MVIHWGTNVCQMMVVLWGTDVMTSFRCYLYFIILFWLLYFFEPLYTQMLWCRGYYLFIFSSGMECRALSQRCGRLYFPIFLFRVGLFILMYMASLMALAILCPSLPMILKFSTAVVWPLLFWCSKMDDGALKCLYIFPQMF